MPEPIAPAVATAVTQAYYPESLKEADNARSRAQNGYTIAGAVAAAIVAAGVFGDLSEERTSVQALGVLALITWLAAAIAFMWAVAASADPPSSGTTADADSFVRAVLKRARDEQAAIEKRISAALVITVVAIVITALTLVLLLTTSAASGVKHGDVVLTEPGAKTLAEICGSPSRAIRAAVDPSGLTGGFVPLVVDNCGGSGKQRTVRVVKGSIAAFAAD